MTKDKLKKEAEEWVANEIGEKDLRCVRAYIDSAEPREKQLQEKERKIAELEQIINDMQNAECTSCTTLGGMQIKIADLEKENAELKKKVENLQKYLDTRNCYRECAETWLKLTEAKKLLKQFLEAKNGEDTYKAEWDTEQFLKDCEVEK